MCCSKWLGILLISCLLGCTPTLPQAQHLDTPALPAAAVQAFIADMVAKHDYNPQQLSSLFKQVQVQPKVLALMTTPYEAKPWYIYRNNFLNQARIDAGVQFWHQHAKVLAQTEQQTGVPAAIIVAILGVETHYGKIQGQFKAIDSLSTLAFLYPPRANFFKSELEQLLLLSRDMHKDPRELLGSYAGALGWPQFMPSSYRHYAVASGHTGYSDLFANTNDVIASIANYFKANGWQARQPIAIPAKVSGSQYQRLTADQLKPQYTLAQLAKAGVLPKSPIASDQKLAFLKLPLLKGNEYWLGFANFYALSRYNPRLNYTMAVYQLSEQLTLAYQKSIRQ